MSVLCQLSSALLSESGARAGDDYNFAHKTLRHTYLERSAFLSAETGADVYCKLENLQHTGSFKARGAIHKLLRLSSTQRARGVVAASTGNHGAAVAHALDQLGAEGLVFVPANASPSKLEAIVRRGAQLRRIEGDPVEAERAARRHAARNGLEYISPYNDPDVVAGQGTVGVELLEDIDGLEAVFVATGGGGLISGVAAALKAQRPQTRVIGCSPEASAVMLHSVAAGRVLDLASEETLSDGTAGGVEDGALTLELCKALVDEWTTVTEQEIAASLRDFVGAHSMLIEGAAAVAIAALRKSGQRFANQRVAVVICGGNINLETLCSVL